MGIIANLFGTTGKVRFEVVDEEGRSYTGKTAVEAFCASRKDIEEKIADAFYVETGKRGRVTITGFYEC